MMGIMRKDANLSITSRGHGGDEVCNITDLNSLNPSRFMIFIQYEINVLATKPNSIRLISPHPISLPLWG